MIEQDNLWGIAEVTKDINANIFQKDKIYNEKLLLILNKESGLAPYCHEFTNLLMIVDDDVHIQKNLTLFQSIVHLSFHSNISMTSMF
ncbi:MAG: hypothetical protein ACFFEV_09310 [Candidatus Thorarchaeota archaeon]